MKQSVALDILKQGYCVFLTGQAGAGKTYLLNQYIKYLHEHGIPVAVTASTGIAATSINGMTIHSWAGIGIKNKFDNQDFLRLKKRVTVIDRLKAVRVLIIDEVSMLHAHQLDLIDKVLRHVRESDEPFGGVQVIFSGDFFQLPPIGEKNETTKDKFAFMSKIWIALANDKSTGSPAIKVCYLDEQHRQTETTKDTLSLSDILNQIRTQTISEEAVSTLLATKNNDILPHRTRLYTHNIDVENINQSELDKLDGKSYEFEAVVVGDPALVENLKKNVRTPEILTLKKGAKVMFVKNNPLGYYYNGTLGEVIDFVTEGSTQIPKVQLNDGKIVLTSTETWSIDDEEGIPVASFEQVPLCLAWAITIHKSQGMTLDAAEIDLSRTFELGQGYVALSRVKSLKGLKLLGLNQKSLLLDSFAQAANQRFLTLSADNNDWLLAQTKDDIKDKQEDFLKKNAVFAPLKKSQKTSPTSMLDSTSLIDCIYAQKSLDELKELSHLAKSTIIDEIAKQLHQGTIQPNDITYLLPDNAIVQKVCQAYRTLDDKGELANRPITTLHQTLEGLVSYDDIRLSYMLINYLSNQGSDYDD